MIRRLFFYFSNLIKYIRSGGVVYTNISVIESDNRFRGKKVFISGGTSGIGLAIAKAFLSEGAEVIISGRSSSKCLEIKNQLNNKLLHTIEWDISITEILDSKIKELLAIIGSIDVFINNAGIYESLLWKDIEVDIYDRILKTNERGLFFSCQKEVEYLLKNGGGKIINILSIAGLKSGFNPYSVSKWGATCMTKGLAKEFADKNIIVNGIAPGNVVTNIHDGVRGKNVEDNAYTAPHLTQRYTLVEEVASLALYLSSDAANNIVGQVIAIDGGWSLN